MPRFFSASARSRLRDSRPGRYSVAVSRPVLALLVVLLGGALPAQAVEYRLQVANLYQSSFAHFLNGRIGRGEGELRMERLERSLDGAAVPSGVFLYRPFQAAREGLAASLRATPVRAGVSPAEGKRLWDEAVWDGRPGERSVWVIAPSATHDQEVAHLALRGRDVLRYYVPYGVAATGPPGRAVTVPLQFLQAYEGRSALWDRYLSRAVSPEGGLAVVVGVNQNPSFADWVYIIVVHPAEPSTFKVVVGWDRRRSADASNIEGRWP